MALYLLGDIQDMCKYHLSYGSGAVCGNIGNNDTDLYSYFKEHDELPDIITVRRFSGTDEQDLQPYLMDFASYDVVSKYYSYAVQYYKNTEDEIQWLPICGIPQTIIANKTLFDQYGIKIPENYEEYVQACQQFYDNGIKPYSMDLGEDWSNNEIIQAASLQAWMVLNGETVQKLQRMK
jgi:raffinose/stachyose/melibiose transport system substrate-binding protein